MAIKIPKANTAFQILTESGLYTQSVNIAAGLLTSIADYPTPPVLPAALAALNITYLAALTAARFGSKQQTADKDAAKQAVMNALRIDAAYVNQITYNRINAGTSYADAETLVLGTGYELRKDPTPVGNIGKPNIDKYGSFEKGQIYLLVERLYGTKAYQVEYKQIIPPVPPATDPTFGPINTFVSPTSRILLTGLTSTWNYNVQVACVGTTIVRNFSDPITQVVI